jgi:hypothetical protein
MSHADNNALHINVHVDEQNDSEEAMTSSSLDFGATAFSLSVFEDSRDEFSSGLFYQDGPTRIFTGSVCHIGIEPNSIYVNSHLCSAHAIFAHAGNMRGRVPQE